MCNRNQTRPPFNRNNQRPDLYDSGNFSKNLAARDIPEASNLTSVVNNVISVYLKFKSTGKQPFKRLLFRHTILRDLKPDTKPSKKAMLNAAVEIDHM